MTTTNRPIPAAPLRHNAGLFSALGDRTRLSLVARLSSGEPLSIARLTQGERGSRQAISKHLGVLRRAGIVRSVKRGRENRFALDPRSLADARECLDLISRRWDDALARLKVSLESNPDRASDRA